MKKDLTKWIIVTVIVWLAVLITVTVVKMAPSATQEAPSEATPPPDVEHPPVQVSAFLEPYEPPVDCDAAELIAKAVWGEARGCSKTEQAAVVWCILNRADHDNAFFPDEPGEVTIQPGQFDGYNPNNPVEPEILALVEDVLIRWSMEKICVGSVGRVLPPEYLFFEGDGRHNHFRTQWEGGTTWDWSLPSPYEEETHETPGRHHED